MTNQTAVRQQSAAEAARIMTNNLRCRFWSYKAGRSKFDKRFKSQTPIICLREHIRDPSDEDGGVDYDICLLGPKGLLSVLAISCKRPTKKTGPEVWSELLRACENEGLELEPWLPHDIPDGVEAIEVLGPVSHWSPVVF